MARKKLTQRQRRRIDARRSYEAAKAVSEQALDALEESDQLGPEQTGIVVTRYSNQADVVAADAADDMALHRCHLRSHLDSLVTGDRVIWRKGEPYGLVCSVLPRSNLLERPDNRGHARPVVANIDRVLIVVAAKPEARAGLIDRYLVACEYHGIAAGIVLNKIDLDSEAVDTTLRLAKSYEPLGYPVYAVSAKTGAGIAEFARHLQGQTAVLVGQSGVGKSSLINSICPHAPCKTGDLSQAKTKGRHTTTTANLYPLPDGGWIIDSPGIREFGLLHINLEDVAYGFVEFRPFLGQCDFRNCRHIEEPGCALSLAYKRSEISRRRLDSFRQISESLNSQS